MPGVLTAAFLILNRLTFSPRFFLLGLPLAILVAVQGIDSIAGFVAKRISRDSRVFSPRLATAIVLVGSVISLASLKRYYTVPKQAYRASLQFIEAERQPDEKIIVIHLAETGYRFYAPRFGLTEGTDFFSVRSVETLDAVLSSHDEQESAFLVTTFPRALRLTYPELDARIAHGWTRVHTFPGTIGDGEISVWKQRQSDY